MKDEIQTGLVLMHIHKDIAIEEEEIVTGSQILDIIIML